MRGIRAGSARLVGRARWRNSVAMETRTKRSESGGGEKKTGGGVKETTTFPKEIGGGAGKETTPAIDGATATTGTAIGKTEGGAGHPSLIPPDLEGLDIHGTMARNKNKLNSQIFQSYPYA